MPGTGRRETHGEGDVESFAASELTGGGAGLCPGPISLGSFDDRGVAVGPVPRITPGATATSASALSAAIAATCRVKVGIDVTGRSSIRVSELLLCDRREIEEHDGVVVGVVVGETRSFDDAHIERAP